MEAPLPAEAVHQRIPYRTSFLSLPMTSFPYPPFLCSPPVLATGRQGTRRLHLSVQWLDRDDGKKLCSAGNVDQTAYFWPPLRGGLRVVRLLPDTVPLPKADLFKSARGSCHFPKVWAQNLPRATSEGLSRHRKRPGQGGGP